MRQRCQEFVLEPVRLLHADVEPRVFERDGRPRRDTEREALVTLREFAGFRMAKEKPPNTSREAS